MSKIRLESRSPESLNEMKARCQNALASMDSMDASPKVLEYARGLRVEAIKRIDEALSRQQSIPDNIA